LEEEKGVVEERGSEKEEEGRARERALIRLSELSLDDRP